MVTRRNTCARAIRSAAPEAAIPRMRAAGTSGFAAAMAVEEGDQPRGRQLRKDFCGFRNGGRSGEMARHAPPLSPVRPHDRVGERVEGLVDVVRRVGRRGEGVGRVDPVFMGYGVGHAASPCGSGTEHGRSRRERDGIRRRKLPGRQGGDLAVWIVTAAPATETVSPSGRMASERAARHGLPPFQSTGIALSTDSAKTT